mgnify:CR=1 FL=1
MDYIEILLPIEERCNTTTVQKYETLTGRYEDEIF